jgi:uncharacterized protein YbjT (DUF2867 family)
MEGRAMILVVGATGMVGSEICRQLVSQGKSVRGLARTTADPGKIRALEEHSVTVVWGDLRDADSLRVACEGADAVISTVSAMPFSYDPGRNDIETTDRDGQLALIEAAKATGVLHFSYVSFSRNIDRDFPLRNAKRAVEAGLATSGLSYTVLRPSCFMEGWLGPMVGFDYANAKATIYGEGTAPIGYISIPDVAAFAVASLDAPAAQNATLELGGPRSVSQLEAVDIFERALGRPFVLEHVPATVLAAQFEAATDPMMRSFTGLMQCVADGDPIDMRELLKAIPVPLTSVETHAARIAATLPAAVS